MSTQAANMLAEGCRLTLHVPGGIARRGEPVTAGVPLPRGAARETSQVRLLANGKVVPVQVAVTDRWPDGSIRWALLDWLADSDAEYRVGMASVSQGKPPTTKAAIQYDPVGEITSEKTVRYTIRNGEMQWIYPGIHGLFESVQRGDKEVIDPMCGSITIVRVDGQVDSFHCSPSSSSGGDKSIRLELDDQGWFLQGEKRVEPWVRVQTEFFSGLPVVRFTITLTNTQKATHPEGYWDLGDPASTFFKQVYLQLTLAPEKSDAACRYSPKSAAGWQEAQGQMELLQASSGGENWKSSNHINGKREIAPQFRGYRVATPDGKTEGLRATPIVTLERGEDFLGVTMPEFWQNFPKAIEADGDTITLSLFPKQAGPHELQPGEQKTHTFYVAFGRDGVTEQPMEWCRQPMTVSLDPAWVSMTGAVPYLLPKAEDPHAEYLSLVDAAIEGDDTFEKKREAIDEYGWRHFGDIYGDHEAVYHTGPTPLVSHYNNQYDAVRGFALQFLRSGDRRWRDAMTQLARHVIDIDIYHTQKDKAAYNGGLFWHTCHYIDADTATHRSYPRKYSTDKKCPGGGPSGGHLYTTGLMLHYFLTGDPLAKEAVIGLGQYVINADDGGKTIFRFLDRGPTGHVTASGDPLYHGPGRAPANAVNALIDAHRLSGDTKFLAKCDELLRRCVHPKDDLAERRLSDVENKWFYTMFLQSLGKYLDYKAERGELDFMYGYARESLLHYARWMAEHEYPYLDKPEILEYPTETWAAQDMRKSEVFKLAARHAIGAERERFLERADFFFNDVTRRLSGMKTRTLCRPVVLLLSYGGMHGWFKRRPVEPLPPPEVSHDFGRPSRFVPQKIRAKKKAKLLVVAGGAAFMLMVAAAVVWWMMR